MQTAFAAEDSALSISLTSEPLFSLGPVTVTNTILMTWVVVALLAAIAFLVGRRLKKIPSRTQAFFELLIGGMLDYMESVLESREVARRYFPVVATIFFFILAGNWLGIVPGFEQIFLKTEAHGYVPLFHAVSADLNTTLALALVAFVVVEVAGVSALGILKYGGKFVNFKSPIGFFVGIIELLSELARLVSFSFRLFGNIFAGKVLLLVVMFFVPLVVPVPLMLYEIFVGFIQAAIFALLTLFFIKIAISEPH